MLLHSDDAPLEFGGRCGDSYELKLAITTIFILFICLQIFSYGNKTPKLNFTPKIRTFTLKWPLKLAQNYVFQTSVLVHMPMNKIFI